VNPKLKDRVISVSINGKDDGIKLYISTYGEEESNKILNQLKFFDDINGEDIVDESDKDLGEEEGDEDLGEEEGDEEYKEFMQEEEVDEEENVVNEKVFKNGGGNNVTMGNQLTNILYPLEFKDHFQVIERVIGKDKLNRYKYKNEDKNKILNKNIFSKIAPKMQSILDCIKDSEGIVMIHSRFIRNGVLPFCLALESQLGYERYQLDNLLLVDKIDKKVSKPAYVLLTGQKTLTIENYSAQVIKALNAEENKNGDKIKVVVINDAFAEGYDFKNVRELHIMEPW
jgi:hypothetical protein